MSRLVGTFLFVTVSVASAQPRPADEPLRLPEVRVTAPARLPTDPLPASSIPASVQVVPGEDIKRSGAVTLQDYLTRLPGVTLSDEQGNSFQPSLSFRGFQASPVTGIPQGISVFVDGVRINEPDVEEINFDLLPVDDIDRIEIIRGPSAIFGRNTLAGAVNVVTRRGGEVREAVAEASGGSFGREKFRIRLGGTEKAIDYYVSGTLFREDGWRDASASRLGKALGKLGYKDDTTDVTLSFQYANNRIEQPGSLPESELRQDRTRNFTPGDFFAPRMNFGTVNVRQELSGSAALLVNAFGRTLDSEQFNVNIATDNTRLFNNTASAGTTIQLNHDAVVLGRTNRLVLGVDYVYNDVAVKVFDEKNARTLASCVDDAVAAGQDPAAACPLKTLATRVRDWQNGVGAYVQDTFDVLKDVFRSGDSLVFTGAARWDWLRHDIEDRSPPEVDRASATGVSTFSRLNPRVGLNYNLSRDYGVYATYSEGFRAPAFLELTCAGPAAACPGLQAGAAPDPPLKSVISRNYEVGVRARPVPWLSADLSVFRTDVSHDIFSISPTGTTAVFFQNIGDTRRQGLELALRGTYGERLEGYVNYTLTEATFQTDVILFTPRLTEGCAALPCMEPVRKGNDFPLIPRHRLNAGIDYRLLPWLTLSLSGVYVGEQRFRGDEENVAEMLKAYTVVNTALKANFKQLDAFVWINNVLNNRYETFGTFAPNPKLPGAPVERFLTPAPPIHVIAGLSYRF